MNRLLLAATIAVLTVMGAPTTALADNWGAADWGSNVYEDGSPDEEPHLKLLCSTPDSHPMQYRFGECTANNNNPHIVSISEGLEGVQPSLANALRNSIENDYNSIVGVYAYEDSDPGDFYDARAIYGTINENWGIAFTYCPITASFGLSASASSPVPGYRYHMSCTPQVIRFQDTDEARDCWGNGACRKHYACHELGHTLGLQHPIGINNPDTCMGYNNVVHPQVLRPHDENHLVNCYPHSEAILRAWWRETRTAECELD